MQTVRNAASRMPGSQSCWQRNWPRVFLLFALVTAVLCFVSIITGLITAVLQPRLVLLSIYCLIFALLGFSAELRQFTWCRRIVYLWMRFFYFLTYYKARALFYIMFGLLLVTGRTLDIIAAIVTLVLGFMMLLVALIVDLPVFEDPREQQEREEEYRNYYMGGAPPSSAGAPADSKKSQNMTAAGYGVTPNTILNDGVQPDSPATFNSGGVDRQPNSHFAKVPPNAMPARTNRENANNYKDHPYHDSSNDEPVRGYASNTYTAGPNMSAPPTSAQSTDVSPPLQEAGVTRGGGSAESAIRRDFAAAMVSSLKDDDLR